MARNIIKSIERGGYRYDVEETGDGARPYDVHQLHKAQGHWVDAGYGRYCASMAEADALAQRFIGEIKEICNI